MGLVGDTARDIQHIVMFKDLYNRIEENQKRLDADQAELEKLLGMKILDFKGTQTMKVLNSILLQTGSYYYTSEFGGWANTPVKVGDVWNVRDTDDEDKNNVVWVGDRWDNFSSKVKLSDYYTKTEVDTAIRNISIPKAVSVVQENTSPVTNYGSILHRITTEVTENNSQITVKNGMLFCNTYSTIGIFRKDSAIDYYVNSFPDSVNVNLQYCLDEGGVGIFTITGNTGARDTYQRNAYTGYCISLPEIAYTGRDGTKYVLKYRVSPLSGLGSYMAVYYYNGSKRDSDENVVCVMRGVGMKLGGTTYFNYASEADSGDTGSLYATQVMFHCVDSDGTKDRNARMSFVISGTVESVKTS